MDFEDIGMMVKTTHRGYLSDYSGLHGSIDSLPLVDDLDGDMNTVGDGARLVDFSKATAAQEVAQLVLTQNGSCWDGGAFFSLFFCFLVNS